MSQGIRGTFDVCSVDVCSDRALARRLCGKHYRRWSLYGDPLLTKSRSVWVPEYTEMDRGHDTLCWVVAATDRYRLRCRWLLDQLPERPPGTVYMHLCERWGEPNRCVNPDHIKVGTRAENNAHKEATRVAAGVPHHQTGRRKP